jgi:hypothetical protein
MTVWVLKLKSVNSKTSQSRSFRGSLQFIDDSNDYVMFVERQAQVLLAKPNLSLEKRLNVKVLFIKIKLMVWNMKNVSMWYQKKPIPQMSIFCLIQSINNYAQINTYWRYIIQIMASNILLLASNFFFLTSQWLVGTVMNCRALKSCPN